jgi:hypothetical protein
MMPMSIDRNVVEHTKERVMRIVRDYFGLDRTTVVYDIDQITGVGGDPSGFVIVAEVKAAGRASTACMRVKFSHDEMSRILAEYRHHYPIDCAGQPPSVALIEGPRTISGFRKIWLRLLTLFGRRDARRRITSAHAKPTSSDVEEGT